MNYRSYSLAFKLIIFYYVFCSGLLLAQTNYWEPTTSFTSSRINDIGIFSDVFGDDVIFVATEGDGIYVSTDQGNSWVPRNNGLPSNTLEVNAVEWTNFMGEPKVYAGGTFSGLYKNSPSGSAWEPVNGANILGTYGIFGTGGHVYVSTNFSGGIYRSTDNGITWEGESDSLWGAHVISSIVTNPTIFAGSLGGGVFRSYDYEIWEAVNNGLFNDLVYCLEFDGNGNLFAGTEGGVFHSTDDGENWIVGNNGLPNFFISSMAINSDNHIFVGTFLGVARSTDQGSSWVVLNSGLSDHVITALELNAGQKLYAGTASGIVYRSTGITDVNNDIGTPIQFLLYQNYPNPFNPSTKIQYSISERSNVTLGVFDILGNEVATLVDEELFPGSYETEFVASHLSSGLYFYKLQSGYFVETKKMILLK